MSDEVIEAVKRHALANYTKGGWDIVVECWEDSDIAEFLADANASGVEDAIKVIGEIVGIHEERRFEAQAASGELEYYGIVEHEGRLIRKSELEDA